jgi:cell division septum initiation protein DivIVA
MSIQIESDLKEFLDRIEKRFDRVDEKFEKLNDKIDLLDNKVDNINLRLTKVETKLDSELPALQKGIDEIKGSQKAQIWTLIGILFTAVTGFLLAVGKFLISGNP